MDYEIEIIRCGGVGGRVEGERDEKRGEMYLTGAYVEVEV